MIKLIASDLDGTLLPYTQVISDAAIESIARAKQKGIGFVAVSGRGYSQARIPLEEAGIDCDFILLNGAELRSGNGELIGRNSLTHDEVDIVLAYIAKKGMYNEFYSNDEMFSTHDEKTLEMVERYKMEVYRHLSNSGDLPLPEKIKMYKVHSLANAAAIRERNLEVSKVIALSKDMDKVQKVMNEMEEAFPQLTVTASSKYNIEISSGVANKGNALKEFAAMKGIAPHDVMAIGDNLNDISMLTGFGITVAMGNACDEAKAAAQYQTLDNMSDGVAIAIGNMLDGRYQ